MILFDAGGVNVLAALAAFVVWSKIVNFELMRESVKKEFAKKAKFIPFNMEAIDRGKSAAMKG